MRRGVPDDPDLDRHPGADLRALEIDAAATFVLSPDGRIVHENEPGSPAGPRLFVGGCRDGQVVLVRHDVEAATAAQVRELVEASPSWFASGVPHPALDALTALLAPASVTAAIIYRLPHDLAFEADAVFVEGGTPQGDRLLARLAEEGMPPLLVEAGFVGLDDFWAPWCVALVEGEIAAMAFAARLGEGGAEIGVYTFPPYRGRGLAAAVTARWSGLPELAGRMLFYSTLTTNLSSQRVAARLALPRLGASFRIA
jgi:hypothetical protein